MKQPARPQTLPAPAGSSNAQRAAFLATVERLKRVIDRETSMLRSQAPIDLDGYNQQKQQGLLELTRQIRALAGLVPDAEICNRLGELRAGLEKNSYALQTHLRAAQEVSAIVARTIQEAESDGTYSLGVNIRARRSE